VLAGGEVTPDDARFFAAPVPIVVHIAGASVYSVLGAFQFSRGLRRRRRGWHRKAGWLLVPSGLAVALSGLWMTLFYPLDGELLAAFRLLFGSAMAAAIVLGVAAVRRRDFARHGAWMMRAYAIGLGAGTQVLTLGSFVLLAGEPGELGTALLMASGWVINLAVAESVIRRRPTTLRRPRTAPAAPA
jgi:uncharacterized membrane protein